MKQKSNPHKPQGQKEEPDQGLFEPGAEHPVLQVRLFDGALLHERGRDHQQVPARVHQEGQQVLDQDRHRGHLDGPGLVADGLVGFESF